MRAPGIFRRHLDGFVQVSGLDQVIAADVFLAFDKRPIAQSAAVFGHRSLDFVRADIADMGGKRPAMTERIFDLAITIAPEHVGDRHGYFCAGFDCARDGGVNVFDKYMHGDR